LTRLRVPENLKVHRKVNIQVEWEVDREKLTSLVRANNECIVPFGRILVAWEIDSETPAYV
jgi:hypothetical protein